MKVIYFPRVRDITELRRKFSHFKGSVKKKAATEKRYTGGTDELQLYLILIMTMVIITNNMNIYLIPYEIIQK